jgi:hypothetical protein
LLYGLYGPVAGNPACIRWPSTVVGLKEWIIEAPPLHVLASGVPVPALFGNAQNVPAPLDCIVNVASPQLLYSTVPALQVILSYCYQ